MLESVGMREASGGYCWGTLLVRERSEAAEAPAMARALSPERGSAPTTASFLTPSVAPGRPVFPPRTVHTQRTQNCAVCRVTAGPGHRRVLGRGRTWGDGATV